MVCHLLGVAAIVALLSAHVAGYPWSLCGGLIYFKANSTYEGHLRQAAAILPVNASVVSQDLFATAIFGAVPDQILATALCRGDVTDKNCFSCLTQAFLDLANHCSFDKEGSIYYDPCMVHYSPVHGLPDDDSDPSTQAYYQWNTGNVTSDPARYDRVVAALVNATADHAALNSTRRFATGEADFNKEFPKVYSLAQCTPDYTPAHCRRCLAYLIDNSLESIFTGRIGARSLSVNCTYRFETAPFYNGSPMVRLGSARSGASDVQKAADGVNDGRTSGGRKHRVLVVVLAVVLPTLTAMALIAFLSVWRRRRPIPPKKQTANPMYSTEAEDMEMVESLMMNVSTLRAATGDFAESNKLGKGGFGVVYKGVLPDGDEIAVKRLSKSSTQGAQELKNELALVAKLKHKNLVKLVGVCLEQQERLIVYEFVRNRSLDLFLFGSEQSGKLDWEQRYKIIYGIARGLQYLHEDSQLKVVHRDLKASNILLDDSMNPKISDFGIARIFGRDQTQAITNHIIGTYGYMAPEYMMRGNYSSKSDIYSFGVIIMEIVTGRKNNDFCNSRQSEDLLATVWKHWEAGTVQEIVDPCMSGSLPMGAVLRCIQIGLLCVQGDPATRPEMWSVVMMLSTDTITLQAPSKPTFFVGNSGANTIVSTASRKGTEENSSAIITGGVSCSGVLVLIFSVLPFLVSRRRIKSTNNNQSMKVIGRSKCTIFDLATLQKATENFSEKNKLGEGGFGTVYMGKLSGGQEIAVKKLQRTTGHGLNQLLNEVLILAELQHKNLVRLQGFCSDQNEMLLVYEYIKNGSLDGFLFDVSGENVLNWEQQHNIILGIAKGILYLHEDSSIRIIHRDLKANNILLDEDMGPKIADFGLAKLLGDGHTHTETSRAAGTLGYMAPEYAILGNVSPKIDIFSFGVLVLEIVFRRSNSSYDDRSTMNLLTDVWDYWRKGTISQMLDHPLDRYSRNQALRCIHVGLLCVQSEPDDRPDISSVVFMLTRDNMELQSPVEPAFYFGREPSIASLSSGQSCSMNDRSGSAIKQDISVNEVTVTEPYPR
ncbi:hypothetical protein ACP4OV_009048 [Aristida adscensionis]